MSRTQVAFWRSTIQPCAPATSKARNSTHLQALRRMCLPHSPNTFPNHVPWPLAVWFLALFRALIRTPGNLPMLWKPARPWSSLVSLLARPTRLHDVQGTWPQRSLLTCSKKGPRNDLIRFQLRVLRRRKPSDLVPLVPHKPDSWVGLWLQYPLFIGVMMFTSLGSAHLLRLVENLLYSIAIILMFPHTLFCWMFLATVVSPGLNRYRKTWWARLH